TLQKDQETWRRRRSQEHLVLKSQARKLEETRLDVQEIRELLSVERNLWEKQQETLQRELHGLNNRIVHQRLRVQEQQAEITRHEATLRARRAELGQSAVAEVVVAPVAESEETSRRCIDLDRLAGELADQRILLIEQYNRLTAIQ